MEAELLTCVDGQFNSSGNFDIVHMYIIRQINIGNRPLLSPRTYGGPYSNSVKQIVAILRLPLWYCRVFAYTCEHTGDIAECCLAQDWSVLYRIKVYWEDYKYGLR